MMLNKHTTPDKASLRQYPRWGVCLIVFLLSATAAFLGGFLAVGLRFLSLFLSPLWGKAACSIIERAARGQSDWRVIYWAAAAGVILGGLPVILFCLSCGFEKDLVFVCLFMLYNTQSLFYQRKQKAAEISYPGGKDKA